MPRKKAKGKLKIRARHTGRLERRGNRFYARWMEGGVRHTEAVPVDIRNYPDEAAARTAAGQWLTRRLAPLRSADSIRRAERDEAAVRSQLEAVYRGELANIAERRDSDEADGVPPVAVAEAFDRLVSSPEYKTPKAGTLAQVKGQIARFTDWLAERHPSVTLLREVTPAIAKEYAGLLKAAVGKGTYNNILITLRQLWRILSDEIKGDGKCPFAKFAIQKRDASQRRPLTDAELKAVFDGARGDRDLTTLLALLTYTGARLSDCCLMRWDGIDFARGIVSFTAKKTGATCRPPLMPELRALLVQTPETERTGYIIPAFAETYKAYPARMSILVMRHFRKCGIETTARDEAGRSHPVTGAHAFRHTFVSRAGLAGVPLAVCAGWVGHMSKSMTEGYFHDSDAATLMYARAIPRIAVVDAPQALPCDSGVTMPADGADAAEGRRAALCAILDGMTADELRRAQAEIADRIGNIIEA